MGSGARIAGLLALLAGFLALGAPAAKAAGAPQILDSWASGVTASSAEVQALVNPNGRPTLVRVEYLTEAAYRANLAAVPLRDGFTGAIAAPASSGIAIGEGSLGQPFQQRLTGLKASTAYRYRVVATNTETTHGDGHVLLTDPAVTTFSLLDSRGWEMVSPAEKNGGAVAGPEATFGGGVFQAAADGGSVTYTSPSSFGAAQGAPGASQYLARRAAAGWSNDNITLPLLAGAFGDRPDGVPYQLFSTDLSRALVLRRQRCQASEPCPRTYLLRESAGGALTATAQAPDLAFAGAAEGLGQVVLSSCAALTPDATETAGPGGDCDPAATNLYRRSGAGLSLVNLLPGETEGTPGATLAAARGAVSADGSRVYWVDEVSGNLFVREGAQTFQVDAAVGGGGTFQAAGPDGAVAFFTKTGHIYRYDAVARSATDLTPGGEVLGVLGASADGSYLYYVTAGGLFLRHGASVTPVAPEVAAGSYPPASGSARLGAGGTRLAFLSRAALTEFDSHGAQELYLYDAVAGTLTCASCNPSGERPLGDASIPGAVANGSFRAYKPRALSADGRRLFFDSGDALVPQDTNGAPDVYEWEAAGTGSCAAAGGCVALVSSGRSQNGASFIDAGADGADAFFITDGSLVPDDFGAVDLYDARVGGGFPVPPSPIPCLGDSCQPIPGEPEDPTPGTLLPGRGNPPLSFPAEKAKPGKKKPKAKKKGARKRHGKRHHKAKRGRGAR